MSSSGWQEFRRTWAGTIAQLRMHKVHPLGVVVPTQNPNTQEVDKNQEFKASLGCMKSVMSMLQWDQEVCFGLGGVVFVEVRQTICRGGWI